MKKRLIIILMIQLVWLFLGITNGNNESNYMPKEIKHNVAISTNDIENGEYENVLPLYNIYDDCKYTYYEFVDGGYMIIHNGTGEMVEQTKKGKIDFVGEINYYFGPFNCVSKVNDQFIDVYSNKIIDNFEEKFLELSNMIDELFLEKEKEIRKSKDRVCIENMIRCRDDNAEYNGYDLINGMSFDINYANLISNYCYFMSDPLIGENTSDSISFYGNTGICGPVAAQLLLSYLNYYVDRRIIPDEYLNGYDYVDGIVEDYSKNPNYCDNPNYMGSEVIGSSSDLEEQYSFINVLCEIMMEQNETGMYPGDVVDGIFVYFDTRNFYDYVIDSLGGSNYNAYFLTIKNYIDNDIPLIIGTTSKSPYKAHYEVCYGYTEFYVPEYNYTYNGYVIHNGYYGCNNQIEWWVNSKWCDFYLEIDINHTHNYDSRVLIPNSSTYEYRCSTCGHRTTHIIDYNYENNANRMFEKNITLDGKMNRIKEFYFKPNITSNRIITTLGERDVILKLKAANGTLIGSDDDGGYGYNGMINASLTANTWYKIQIILNEYVDEEDMDDPINLSLLIFNSNRDQATEFTDFDILSSSKTSYLERNESLIYRFTPPSTGSYTFKTDYSDNARVDTYMYIYNMADITDKAYNDDGANSQATITKNLSYDTSYLIIITAYNPNTQNGVVSFLLNNNRAQLPSSIKTSRIMRNTINVTSSSGTYTDKYGNNAYKVTDSSMTSSSQPKFVLDLTNLGINLPTLQNSPYQSVLIFIQFSVYEISDGYQKIYIRNQAGNNYVSPITNMEHGSGYKDGNYTTYVFYAEIPKSSINSTYLEINFSASGSGNDDWVFINPVVSAGYSNQSASNTSILKFEGLCVKDF